MTTTPDGTGTFEPDTYVDVTREQYLAWLAAGKPTSGAGALPTGARPIDAAGLNRMGQALASLSENVADLATSVQSTAVRAVVALSAADYAALAVKDPATLYVVTGAPTTPAPSGPAKAATLVDTFDAPDGTRWQTLQGVATITGGAFDLTPAYSPDGTGYTTVSTVGTYDLTSSALVVHIGQWPAGSNPMDLDVWLGSRLSDHVAFAWEAGTVYCIHRNGTTKTSHATVSTADPWWRFRHDGSTVYWETSPDGSAYTVRAQVPASALTWDLTAARLFIDCGYYDGGTTVSAHALLAGVNAA